MEDLQLLYHWVDCAWKGFLTAICVLLVCVDPLVVGNSVSNVVEQSPAKISFRSVIKCLAIAQVACYSRLVSGLCMDCLRFSFLFMYGKLSVVTRSLSEMKSVI